MAERIVVRAPAPEGRPDQGPDLSRGHTGLWDNAFSAELRPGTPEGRH